MADVKWIKLTTDMFDNRKIKHLRRLPEGNNIVLIWVMLLTMAGRCNANGMIFLTENIPYTPKMLADELDFEENTVKLALEALSQLNMVGTDSGHFTIAGWQEYQNIEGMDKIREQNRIRKQRQREKQKALPEPSHVKSRDSHATEIEEEKELEKDKKKKKEQKIYSDVPELNQAILSFLEFRKSIKKPMTDHAVELLFKKLNGMTDSIDEQIEIINQSIVNGWQGVFPLKEQKTQQIRTGYHKQTKAEELDDFYKMAAEWSES